MELQQFDFHIRYINNNRYRNILLTFFGKDNLDAEKMCKQWLNDAKYKHWEIRKVTAKRATTI